MESRNVTFLEIPPYDQLPALRLQDSYVQDVIDHTSFYEPVIKTWRSLTDSIQTMVHGS